METPSECSVPSGPYWVRVHLSHTDAAGLLYFARAFELAHAAYEQWLEHQGAPIDQWINGAFGAWPVIAEAKGQFLEPIGVGTALAVYLHNGKMGQHSFRLRSHFYTTAGKRVLTVRTDHVTMDPVGHHPTVLPQELRDALAALPRENQVEDA